MGKIAWTVTHEIGIGALIDELHVPSDGVVTLSLEYGKRLEFSPGEWNQIIELAKLGFMVREVKT